jgi:deoxyribose-phosphate aldolase
LGATTFEHIALIKAAVGSSIQLKVAGGVRNLDTLLKMVQMGVTRFGIGHVSAINIMNEFNQKL